MDGEGRRDGKAQLANCLLPVRVGLEGSEVGLRSCQNTAVFAFANAVAIAVTRAGEEGQGAWTPQQSWLQLFVTA